MFWKLYKPGQGYWTRLMSGVAGGVLIVAGVAWLFEKLSVLPQPWGVYVQAAAALVVIFTLGPLVYRLVASKPRTSDFLIATEGEMKKVNWPSQKEVTGSTWVVIWCVLLFTALLYVSDVVFFAILQGAGILER